jgi:hypothetical protein
VFSYVEKKAFPKINLVTLNESPLTTVNSLSDFLNSRDEKKRVEKTLFENTFKKSTGGEAYSIEVMMIKLQM